MTSREVSYVLVTIGGPEANSQTTKVGLVSLRLPIRIVETKAVSSANGDLASRMMC
jgi:hypothetical protein